MEKSQYKSVIELLKDFDEMGILQEIVLVGSWAAMFYRECFDGSYIQSIKTRDIDFALPVRGIKGVQADIFSYLKSRGFIVNLNMEGYMQFLRDDIGVEFLVPETGRGSDKPKYFPNLNINAQPLRYMTMLVDNTVKVKVAGLDVNLCSPAAYCLHKFIIFKRRKKKDKAEKDLESALNVFNYLFEKGGIASLKYTYKSLPAKWRKTIVLNLENEKRKETADRIKNLDV